jgi:bifunctional non-homologous end joining protein LigD
MLVVRTDGFVDPCIPSPAPKPPSGPDWVHEVKHDGYRLIVRRDGETVRLFTRRGYDWTGRYPAIASAAAKTRAQSFTLDGEAVVCGDDGVAIFDALHRHGMVRAAILQAFDLLEPEGEDLRPLPLGQRKPRLARLLARAQAEIAINEHTYENGAVVFLHAFKMGLEGIVSKRPDGVLQGRPVPGLDQGQEPGQPSMVRHREALGSLRRTVAMFPNRRLATGRSIDQSGPIRHLGTSRQTRARALQAPRYRLARN